MHGSPSLTRLDARIARSKRSGRLVLIAVLVVSAAFAVVLVHGLGLAREAGRGDLWGRGVLGLALLVGLNLFAALAVRRQHRLLDEARRELAELVRSSGGG